MARPNVFSTHKYNGWTFTLKQWSGWSRAQGGEYRGYDLRELVAPDGTKEVWPPMRYCVGWGETTANAEQYVRQLIDNRAAAVIEEDSESCPF